MGNIGEEWSIGEVVPLKQPDVPDFVPDTFPDPVPAEPTKIPEKVPG